MKAMSLFCSHPMRNQSSFTIPRRILWFLLQEYVMLMQRITYLTIVSIIIILIIFLMIQNSFSKWTNLNTLCFFPWKYMFFLMYSSRGCSKRCYRSLSYRSMMILRRIWSWHSWTMFPKQSPIILISNI